MSVHVFQRTRQRQPPPEKTLCSCCKPLGEAAILVVVDAGGSDWFCSGCGAQRAKAAADAAIASDYEARVAGRRLAS